MSDGGPQIFVFTAGNAAARSHLDDSILSQIAPSTIYQNFAENDHESLRQIEQDNGFYAWGAVPGPQNSNRWQQLKKGDWALCVYESAYHFAARVLAKYDNASCAREIWGSDPNGETWQLMYFLAKPVKTDVPLSQVSEYLGARYMGFTRISDARLEGILQEFGSVDDFIAQAIIDGQTVKAPAPEKQFFLIRSNPDTHWGDEEGRVYRFGSSVPNYKRLILGGSVVVDSRVDGTVKVIGYGEIDPAKELDTYETDQRTNQRYEAEIKAWQSIDPPKALAVDLLSELKALPGYNVQHAVRPIPKEAFNKLTAAEHYWLFQSNPEYFDSRTALKSGNVIWWLVNQKKSIWRTGQKGVIWESGSNGGVIGIGKFISDPKMAELKDDDLRYALERSKFEGEHLRIQIKVDHALDPPISREQIQADERLQNLPVLKFANATNFQISPEEYAAVVDLASARHAGTLKEVVDEFSIALIASNIDFGSQHDDIVRAFVASLATKPFVILTGLSGSGKTQLAIRFGEWLGNDRLHVAAVRPDWTGAESLFGYEDALQRADDSGSRAWHVPAPLAFLLTAARDPEEPYLLVLDEMNLAHVERYFADVLSGMESRKPCLPNLERRSDGSWRQKDGPVSIPFPRNVFVVGTVNVDETTYMFSPKVLDRANTFEFRVADLDLKDDYAPPRACSEAPDQVRRSFLSTAQNDSSGESAPGARHLEVGERLRACHRILSPHNFEFGHRVFSESLRFAAMYSSTGVNDIDMILDRILMQKVLPRLHGSRRRIEKTLIALANFAYDPDQSADDEVAFDIVDGNKVKLPLSFEKLRRMISTVRANQFVSFTE